MVCALLIHLVRLKIEAPKARSCLVQGWQPVNCSNYARVRPMVLPDCSCAARGYWQAHCSSCVKVRQTGLRDCSCAVLDSLPEADYIPRPKAAVVERFVAAEPVDGFLAWVRGQAVADSFVAAAHQGLTFDSADSGLAWRGLLMVRAPDARAGLPDCHHPARLAGFGWVCSCGGGFPASAAVVPALAGRN